MVESQLRISMIFYTKHLCILQLCILAGSLQLLLALPCPAQEQVDSVAATSANDPQQADGPQPVEGYEYTFPALGTLVSLKAYSSDKALVEQAFSAAEQTVLKLEAILTDYDSDSETRQLSSVAVAAPQHVSEELWQVLEASDRWYQRTDGAFDSSLGAVTRLWRKSRRTKTLPSAEEIRHAVANSGWQNVQLDRTAKTVQLLRPEIQLDFGAIGKGYIVDRVFTQLRDAGLPCCLVNISGNMRCGTPPAERDGWRIAISPLDEEGPPLREIVVANTAVATSGDLWQYVMIDGVLRSHILDPHTGVGVIGPIAATVIAAEACDADAFATAACVVGGPRALALANQWSGVELLLAIKTEAGKVEISQTATFPSDASRRPCE